MNRSSNASAGSPANSVISALAAAGEVSDSSGRGSSSNPYSFEANLGLPCAAAKNRSPYSANWGSDRNSRVTSCADRARWA